MKRRDYDAADMATRFQAFMWSLAGLLLGVRREHPADEPA